MVLQYTCRDQSVITTLSTSCQESNWKIAVGGGSHVIDLKLIVDTHLVGKPSVGVVCNGKHIFPHSDNDRAKLKEDLKWQCPFRGTIVGIGERNCFEFKPEHGDGDLWYAATVLEQREDGLFKVAVSMPAGEGGLRVVEFPAVKEELLREAEGQKRPVKTPLRSLILQVPMADPKSSTLSVDGSTLMTHFFFKTNSGTFKGTGRQFPHRFADTNEDPLSCLTRWVSGHFRTGTRSTVALPQWPSEADSTGCIEG